MIFLYITILLIALVAAYTNQYKNYYAIIVFACLIIIYSNATIITGDLSEYEKFYYIVMSGKLSLLYHAKETMYLALMKLFSSLGVSFVFFKNTIYILSLSCLAMNIKKFTDNLAVFLGVYACYFFFIEGHQLRSMIAFSIMLFGVSSLMKEDNYSMIKFILSIALAALVQRTFLLFIVFGIIKYKKRVSSKDVKRIVALTVLLIVMENRFHIISRLLSGDEYGQVYIGGGVRLGWIIPVFMYLVNIAVFAISSRFVTESDSDYFFMVLYNSTKKINLICLLYIPFVTLNLSFYRFIRYGILLNLIYYSTCCERISSGKKRLIYVAGLYLFSLLLLISDCMIHGGLMPVVTREFLHIPI